MASGTRFISVIMPCRQEEKYIAGALTSILANDYPQNCLEVLVVDGMSTDGTRKIVTEFTKIIPLSSCSTTPGESPPQPSISASPRPGGTSLSGWMPTAPIRRITFPA